MGIGGAIIGQAGGVLGAMASFYGAHKSASAYEEANRLQLEEAQRNREWQERMSNTAHQREVKDLRDANLNPILSATGGHGAPVGSGAMATIQSKGQDYAQYIAAAKALSEIKLTEAMADTELTKQAQNSAQTTAIEGTPQSMIGKVIGGFSDTAEQVKDNFKQVYNTKTKPYLAKKEISSKPDKMYDPKKTYIRTNY